MVDVHAEADADGEDDGDEEQVAECVYGDREPRVEKGCGIAENVTHGGMDVWVSVVVGSVGGLR